MKYNYNETNVITGYIKELLMDFNLPVYTVYRKGKEHAGKIYISEDKIVQCDDNLNLNQIGIYSYNKKAEYTKNLIINSSIYDAYTHNYLGNYLRFLRDYKNINLMPLYNCFSCESPVGLNYNITLGTSKKPYIYSIDTTDNNYYYYIIPAKFDEQYTININALVPYELSCIIYTGDTVLDISKELSKLTYKRVNTTGKRYSYLYSTKINDTEEFWKYENNLRILLKLPKAVKSSITILEGDYTNCNNVSGKTFLSKLYIDSKDTEHIDAISKLSLLDNLGETSYPFADRLLEYLLGNVISNLETIPNNISRVQDLLLNNLHFENESGSISSLTFKGFYDTWDDNFIKVNILKKLFEVSEINNTKDCYYNILNYDNVTKTYIKSITDYDKFRPIDQYYDLLGYVDKDTESNLKLNTIVKYSAPTQEI